MGIATRAIGGAVGDVVGGLTGSLAGGLTPQNGFQATGARIDSPATVDQANQLYQQNQDALSQQLAFVNALQAQNGIGNQSSVYNQLQGVANGTGPNPAQAALNQATGANIASQASLMAGQRGANQNAGLIARQAALQGGNIQQQAAGQGATMQAQQSLNALGQLGSLSSQQVAQQGGALGQYGSQLQGEQGNVLNSINSANNTRVNMQNGMNSANQTTSAQNTAATQKTAGGLLNGITGGLFAKGGEVKAANGVYVDVPQQPASPQMGAQPSQYNLGVDTSLSSKPMPSALENFLSGAPARTNVAVDDSSNPQQSQQPASTSTDPLEKAGQTVGKGLVAGVGALGNLIGLAKGGQVKKPVLGEMLAAQGKVVPGQAKVKGNSFKNDTVPALLSPKEIVLPRSVTQHPDAPRKAAEFVAAIMAKKGGGLARKGPKK